VTEVTVLNESTKCVSDTGRQGEVKAAFDVMSLKLIGELRGNPKKNQSGDPNALPTAEFGNWKTWRHATLPITILLVQWKWRNFCLQECENCNEERRRERKRTGLFLLIKNQAVCMVRWRLGSTHSEARC